MYWYTEKSGCQEKNDPLPCKKTSIFCKSASWMSGVMPGHLCCHSPPSLSQHTQVTMRKTLFCVDCLRCRLLVFFLLCIVSMASSYHCCGLYCYNIHTEIKIGSQLETKWLSKIVVKWEEFFQITHTLLRIKITLWNCPAKLWKAGKIRRVPELTRPTIRSRRAMCYWECCNI